MARKDVWWDPFSWGREDPEIITKEIRDPVKESVSGPMAKYLGGEIGKGLPRYEGPGIADIAGGAREFLAMDPGDWYKGAIADPAIAEFKEELFPLITEGFAGSLRSSGRFRAEEAGISTLSKYLAGERYKAERDIPKEQFAMAKDIYAQEYSEWMTTLPQMNPALTQALNFLKGPTGLDVATALDPGQEGWVKDAAAIAVDLVDAIMPDQIIGVG